MSETASSARLNVAYLDASLIDVPDGLDRWTGSALDLQLMKSLEHVGPLEPIGVVDLENGRYQLAYGSRRLGAWKASPFLREKEIPAIVVPLDDALRGTLDENTVRRQLSTTERAKLAKHALGLASDANMSQREVAKHLGMSENRLSMLTKAWGNELIWARVLAGDLPVDAAIGLAGLPAENVAEFLADLDTRRPRPSVREISHLAREWMGHALDAEFTGDDMRERAPGLVEHFLRRSPIGEGLRVRVAWDRDDRSAALTLHLPLVNVTTEYVRRLIDEARSPVDAAPATEKDDAPADADGNLAATPATTAEAPSDGATDPIPVGASADPVAAAAS
jgi:ParB-like chromosome segregation protein Spo0J